MRRIALYAIFTLAFHAAKAADDLVIVDGVPSVYGSGTLDVGKIQFPIPNDTSTSMGTLVLDGATMTATALSASDNDGRKYFSYLELTNNASLTVNGSTYFAAASYGNCTGAVSVTDSALTLNGTAVFGSGAYNVSKAHVAISALRSTVTAASFNLLGSDELSLTDSTFYSAGDVKLGELGAAHSFVDGVTSTVSFVNSTVGIKTTLQLGLHLPAVAMLSGGGLTVGANFSIAGWGTATSPYVTGHSCDMTVSGGAYLIVTQKLSVAAQSGTTASLSLGSGTIASAATMYVGEYGDGELTINSAGGTATTEFKIAVQSGSAGSVVLNGGTLSAKSVIGGLGTSCFSADGGTLKILAAGKIFDNVGTVTIGSGGLMIDTSGYAVTLNQSLSGGEVIFAGGGTVTVGSGVTVPDVDIVGGTKIVWTDIGTTNVIEQSSGAGTRSADTLVNGNDTIVFDIASGASLTVGGKVGIGALVKQGNGLLTLDNELDKFVGGITLAAGTLAFGANAPSAFDTAFALGNAANTLAVIKNDEALMMNFPYANFSGAFLKRGVGELVLERGGGWLTYTPTAPVTANNGFDPAAPLVFGDLTALPTANYACFNVAEGRCVIRGKDPSTRNSFRLQKSFAVGLPVTVCAAQPEFVLDNLTADFAGQTFFLGPAAVAGASAVVSPKLTVTNTAFTCSNLNVANESTNPNLRPKVRADASTVTCGTALFANGGYNNGSKDVFSTFEFANGSALYPNQLTLTWPSRFDFDHSVLASNATLNATLLYYYNSASTNAFAFANESKFYFDGVNFNLSNCGNQVTGEQTFLFDDSEWIVSTTAADRTYAIDSRVNAKVLMRGKGLVLKPASGYTYTMQEELTGEGGFVCRGAGTVLLTSDYLKYTGVTRAEAGAINFGATTIANAKLGGSGTFKNGTLATPTLALEIEDNAVADAPTLDLANGLSLSGRVSVSLGLTEEGVIAKVGAKYPTLTVAHYTGSTAPDVSGWKLVDAPKLGGVFSAADGVVTLSLHGTAGFMILFH